MESFILVLIVMLGFTVITIAVAGRRKSRPDHAPVLPRVVELGALLGAGIAALTGTVTFVLSLVGDRVTLAVPVIAQVEPVPDDMRANTGASVASGLTQQAPISLTVAGLDIATRALVATQLMVVTVIAVVVLMVIARLARQSINAAPFSGALSRSLLISGAVLAVGGTLAQVFGNAAGMRVHSELFELSADAAARSVYVAPGWNFEGSVAKIVKLEHAWRRLDGRNDDGFQVAPFPG